jgi:L-asparagine transporter-like permease
MRIVGKYLVTVGLAFVLVGLYLEIRDYMWAVIFIIPGFIFALYGFRRMDEEEMKHVRNGVHA